MKFAIKLALTLSSAISPLFLLVSKLLMATSVILAPVVLGEILCQYIIQFSH